MRKSDDRYADLTRELTAAREANVALNEQRYESVRTLVACHSPIPCSVVSSIVDGRHRDVMKKGLIVLVQIDTVFCVIAVYWHTPSNAGQGTPPCSIKIMLLSLE